MNVVKSGTGWIGLDWVSLSVKAGKSSGNIFLEADEAKVSSFLVEWVVGSWSMRAAT